MKNVINRAFWAEKNLVFFLAVIVMTIGALTFPSCKTSPNEPEKKGDFEVYVSNITQTTADYKVVPRDMEATYVINLIHSDVASMTDEQILTDMKNSYDLLINYDSKVTGYEYFLKSGVVEGTLNNLPKGAICTIIVVKMDSTGTFSGTLSRTVFNTLE